MARRPGETLAELGHVYTRSGADLRARQILGELARAETYVDPYHMAIVHVGLVEPDAAFGWLEKAFDERSDWLLYILIDPRLCGRCTATGATGICWRG